jgi:hypothetical protein
MRLVDKELQLVLARMALLAEGAKQGMLQADGGGGFLDALLAPPGRGLGGSAASGEAGAGLQQQPQQQQP